MNAIGPNAVVMSKLEAGAKAYKSYIKGVSPDTHDFPIVLGEGYYIFVSDTAVFSLTGDLSLTSTKPLVAGWNLVGYARMEETTAGKLLLSITGARGGAITCLDSLTGLYKSYAPGFPSSYYFEVTPGRAYFVWADGVGILGY